MKENLLIAIAVPVFFLLIFVELRLSVRLRRRVYRFNDAIVDLSCGIAQQLTEIFAAVLLLGAYAFVYEHHRFITWRSSLVMWLLALVGVDFLYYWWHRLSHEVNVLWAAHVVHHQSEDYNLAVALRQSVTTSWTALPFYLPLALLGVPPALYAGSHAISLLYQFWIHTELIGKLGTVENVLNTPSHHRVHHAINPRYLDKNYAAILIVWDRLFGTYEVEAQECVYGLTQPVASFSPLYVQLHYWGELIARSVRTRRWSDKGRVWLRGPGWHAPDEETHAAHEVSRAQQRKYDPPVSTALAWYIVGQLALVSTATLVLLALGDRLSRGATVALAVMALVTVGSFGGLLESRRWARSLEWTRLAGVALCAALLGPPSLAVVAAGVCGIAALWVHRVAAPSAAIV